MFGVFTRRQPNEDTKTKKTPHEYEDRDLNDVPTNQGMPRISGILAFDI